jgi:nucleotide sugar dehydrogenase
MKIKIGFIGQGYIGKNYADDFQRRDFEVVRYSLEHPYNSNKGEIKNCDVVFIAVPTPTTLKGFDDSIVRSVIPLIGPGKIVVIKSTVLPGTLKSIQKQFPKVLLLNSPEFLQEATAARDASFPFSNIVGIPVSDKKHKKAANLIIEILPRAPFNLICDSSEAEIIKYAHNLSAYVQIVFFNLMFDLVKSLKADWGPIGSALGADPFISHKYANPVHKGGRGAGGNCFIKDIAALSKFYNKNVKDFLGNELFKALQNKNIELLVSSSKDINIVSGVYGKQKKVKCGF